MHNEPVGSDKRSWKRGWKGPGGKEKGRKGGKKPCSLPALVSGIGQRSTMLLRLPDALHFSAPSKGACNTQHLKHSGTEGVCKCDFFFGHAKCNILSAGISAGFCMAQTGTPCTCPQLFFQPSSAEVQISAAPDLAQGLVGNSALGNVISEAAAWDLAAGKGLALLRLPPHQEESQS